MGRMFAASVVALMAVATAAGQEEKNHYRPAPVPAPQQHVPPGAAMRVVPFFSSDYTILDSEIGTANAGIVQDTQHVVEPDNKWVGYSTAGTPNAGIGLDVLQEFSYDRLPPLGYVGTPVNAQPSQRQAPARDAGRAGNGDHGA